MKKKTTFYVVMSGISAVAMICSLLIPEMGEFAVFNELFVVMAMGAIIVMLTKLLTELIISKKISSILLVAAVVLIIGTVVCSKSIKIVKDFVSGPEWITILNCGVEKRSTSKGVFGLNYYLKGEDSNGGSYRFYISGNEYDGLRGKDVVTVLCYKNTGRIVEVKR